MIAMTVKTMKLVMKIEWNSFASCSVSPDKSRSIVSAMLGLSAFGLVGRYRASPARLGQP